MNPSSVYMKILNFFTTASEKAILSPTGLPLSVISCSCVSGFIFLLSVLRNRVCFYTDNHAVESYAKRSFSRKTIDKMFREIFFKFLIPV